MILKNVIELLKRFPDDSELMSADYSPGIEVRVLDKHLKNKHTYGFMDFDFNCSDEWLNHCLK